MAAGKRTCPIRSVYDDAVELRVHIELCDFVLRDDEKREADEVRSVDIVAPSLQLFREESRELVGDLTRKQLREILHALVILTTTESQHDGKEKNKNKERTMLASNMKRATVGNRRCIL